MTPSANKSHLKIPPKMLIRITLTLGWFYKMVKAVVIYSSEALPPTSKKLAGSYPNNLQLSIVAIAKPAPLTIQPMLPSKATYERSAATAYFSNGSTSSEQTELFFISTSSFYLY